MEGNMRQVIALVLVGTVLAALALLVGSRPPEDELAVSIERLVQTSR
jgi:hypothetical protein